MQHPCKPHLYTHHMKTLFTKWNLCDYHTSGTGKANFSLATCLNIKNKLINNSREDSQDHQPVLGVFMGDCVQVSFFAGDVV